MADVQISIGARDRVSQTMDEITRSVEALNNALEEMESHPGPDVLKGKMKAASADVGKAWSVMGKGMQTVGGGLTKYITKPAIGAAAGLAGLTLAKGFSRMNQIDTAREKLKAMGVDAGKVKESALKAVDSTAFGLNEAMTVGASAAAAGVKNKDMTNYLTAISNTAAVAGSSYEEMGMVFNKVMANGKVSAEEWNMMTDRGVDISGALQQQLGKTHDEILEMRQAGKITSDDFVAAMGKMYEGAAVSIGENTISGAISNINAALSRIGANLFGDSEIEGTFANRLLPLLKSFKDALGAAEEKAKQFGETLGKMAGPYMDRMTNFFNGIAKGTVQIDEAKVKMGAMAGVAITALGPALKIVGGAFSIIGQHGGIKATAAAFGKIAPQVMRIAGPIGLIITGLIGMWQNSENFRSSVTSLFSSLWQSLQTVATALAPLFQSLMDILGPIMGAIGDMMAPMIDIMASYFESMAQRIATVADFVAPYIEKIAGAVGKASAKIQAMGGAWNAIKSSTKKLMTKVSETAAAILKKIKDAWDKIVSAVKRLTVHVTGGAAGALNSIKGAWDSIKNGARKVLSVVTRHSSTGGGGGGGGGKHATGTKSAAGGLALVGERGPEMVNLPKGASVHPARDTEAMLGGSNIIVNMTNNLAQQGKSVDQIISEFAQKLEAAAAASAEGAF